MLGSDVPCVPGHGSKGYAVLQGSVWTHALKLESLGKRSSHVRPWTYVEPNMLGHVKKPRRDREVSLREL